jgi:hypothetical protein
MTKRVVKTLYSADETLKLEIYQRDDGHFGFAESMRHQTEWGRDYWVLSGANSSIYDSAATAEREARSSVYWLIEPPSA